MRYEKAIQKMMRSFIRCVKKSPCAFIELMLVAMPAHAQAPTEMDIAEVRDLSTVSVSPRGRLAAFELMAPNVAGNEVARDLYVLDAATWKVTHLANAGTPILHSITGIGIAEAPIWSTNGKSIYYRAQRDREIQIWKTDITSGHTSKITSDSADVKTFVLDDSNAIVFYTVGAFRRDISNAEQYEQLNGILLNKTIIFGPLYNNGLINGRIGTLRRWHFGENGSWKIGPLLGNQPEKLRVLNLRTGVVRNASKDDHRRFEELRPAKTSSISKSRLATVNDVTGAWAYAAPVLVRDEIQSQAGTVYQVRVLTESGKVVPCEAWFCYGLHTNLRDLQWTPDGEAILIATEEDGRGLLRRWSPKDESTHVLIDTQGAFTGRDRWSIDVCPILEAHLICIFSAATQPPKLIAISLHDGQRRDIFDPNKYLRSHSFGRVEHFQWSLPDGKQFNGIIVYPSDYDPGSRYPLIVSTYRCRGFLRGGAGNELPEHVLTSLGFVVLCANQNAEYTHAQDEDGNVIPAYGYRVLAESWEFAIDKLSRRGLVDRTRVGLNGFSYSGQAALYAISHSTSFLAASSGSGSSFDPDRFRTAGAAADSDYIRMRIKDFGLGWPDDEKYKQLYADLSPAMRADCCIETPLLLHLKEREADGTAELRTNLIRAGKPVEAFVYPNSAHYIHQPHQQWVVYRRNVDWYRFWLQRYERPDPEAIHQYTRWRKMRDAQCTRLRGTIEHLWYCENS